jgi:hypothetical protein
MSPFLDFSHSWDFSPSWDFVKEVKKKARRKKNNIKIVV